MKKLFFVLCVVSLCFGAVSCKKSCVCTVSVPGTKVTSTTDAGKTTKKDCQAAEDAGNQAGKGIAKAKCVWGG